MEFCENCLLCVFLALRPLTGTDSPLSRVLGLFMTNDPQQVSLRPVYLQASESLGRCRPDSLALQHTSHIDTLECSWYLVCFPCSGREEQGSLVIL